MMKNFTKVVGVMKDVFETNVVEEVNRDNVESALDYILSVSNKDSLIWIIEPMVFDDGV